MKLAICTIFDNKTGAYLQPFFTANVAVAERAISDLVVDPDHQFSKNPEDYVLFDLGQFDDETGLFDMHDAPRTIATLPAIKAAKTLRQNASILEEVAHG
jgi:hypothetical protein